MDCASEAQMARMRLQDMDNIQSLDFDMTNRELIVYHTQSAEDILQELHSLQFDTSLLETVSVKGISFSDTGKQERKLLIQVLAINFSLFALEMMSGIVSYSIGLIADSLDMLADSFVYSLALFAVGSTAKRKKNIAKTAGYFQLLLAVLGLTEVIRRFIGLETLPDFQIIILVSILALSGNAACLYLLQKSKSKEAHMQASMIFTSNDVIINIGVMLAGTLVYLSGSGYPDLIIGCIVFFLVARGAFKILKLSK